MWHRVELNKDGSTKSCVLVETVGTDSGASVVYIDAPDKPTAIRQAKQWIANRKAVQAKANKKRYVALKTAGLCHHCQRPAIKGTIRCAECSKKHAEHNKRLREKIAAGESTTRTNNGGARPQWKSNVTLARQIALVLQDVLDQFNTLDEIDFEEWLNGTLAKLKKTAGIATPEHEAVFARESTPIEKMVGL